MNNEDFNTLLTKRLDSIEAVLKKKAKEYATEDDRLHNFKRAAHIGECTPAQALKGMWLKHLVSVFDIIDDNATGGVIDHAYIDEKLGDAINYLILLEAILKEKLQGWNTFIFNPDNFELTEEQIKNGLEPGSIIRTKGGKEFYSQPNNIKLSKPGQVMRSKVSPKDLFTSND